jgi:transposase
MKERIMARKLPQYLTVVNPDCAGVDVSARFHMVAVPPDRADQPVRCFEAFTDGLEALADWLRECCVRVVAMEATGVYWIPLFELLATRGFEVHLVNSRDTKQVSGRKSDVLDCQWIWQLMTYGLLRGAFRPPQDICTLRTFTRQRERLVRDQSRAILHMQKALTQMNVQLHNVLSEIDGTTGLAILRAIVAGERDGVKLAALRDRRVRADEATIARSLRGTWRDEHLFTLAQALEQYDFLCRQIDACDQHILAALDALAKPDIQVPPPRKRLRGGHRAEALHERLRQAIARVLGVDLTAIPTIAVETALVICAEIGPDLSRFPDIEHFCSWLHLTPDTRISGGKPLPGKARRKHNRAGQAIRQAATNARRSDTFIGAAHRNRLARLDKAKAIKATAHQIARLIYLMLTRGEAYVERGVDAFEQARADRQLSALRRKADRLGYQLVPTGGKIAA